MEKLIPTIRQKLINDNQLMQIVSDVRYWRAPREPKQLIKPVVVFEIFSFTDRDGANGNVLAIVEFNVFSYDQDGTQIIEATKAANRISDILTTDRLVIEGGGHARMSLNTGWSVLDQTDVNTIRITGRFACSYWSPSRIAELTS